jgi:type VI secretion system Hcp family effector
MNMNTRMPRHLLGALLCLCLAYGPVAHADQIFVAIKGKRAGDLTGEVANSPRHIEALSFSSKAATPTDMATGRVASRRTYDPVTLTKLPGPASLQIYQALIVNDELTVTIDFVRPAEDGVPRVYNSIRLSGARVAEFSRKSEPAGGNQARTLDTFAILFNQIEIFDPNGGLGVTDQLVSTGLK